MASSTTVALSEMVCAFKYIFIVTICSTMKNNARSKNLPKNNSGLFLFDKNNFFMGGIIQVPFAKITISYKLILMV